MKDFASHVGMGPLPRRLALAMAMVLPLALGLLMPLGASQAQELKLDPTLVRGPDACGECHKSSVTAWKRTKHSTAFKSLPRSKAAKEIAKNLGIKRIKAESQCLSCHFTSMDAGGKIKPIAGITCESCHGAGSNWIKIHADFGG